MDGTRLQLSVFLLSFLGFVEYVVRRQSVMQTEVSLAFVLQVWTRVSLQTVAQLMLEESDHCW